MNQLDATSLKRLEGVKPSMVSVVKRANELAQEKYGFSLTVLEGIRTAARQAKLYAQGRTKPGPKVTWTLKSKHITGDAVDMGALIATKKSSKPHFDWADKECIDLAVFDKIAICMFGAARELDINIRWGANWDRDGTAREKGEYDNPHFELI